MTAGSAPMPVQATAAPAADDLPPCHAAAMAVQADQGAVGAAQGGKGGHVPPSPPAGDCPLCAAVGSLVSLPTATAAILAPLLVVRAHAEPAATRVPHTTPDRLERPPRTA